MARKATKSNTRLLRASDSTRFEGEVEMRNATASQEEKEMGLGRGAEKEVSVSPE